MGKSLNRDAGAEARPSPESTNFKRRGLYIVEAAKKQSSGDCRTLKVGCPMSRRICETWDYDGLRVSPRRAKKSTPFWMPRFYDFNVWTEKKRIEKLRYIHRNPVARGLVASPEQWPWTSFRWYSSGEIVPVKINDTDILVMTIRPPAA